VDRVVIDDGFDLLPPPLRLVELLHGAAEPCRGHTQATPDVQSSGVHRALRHWRRHEIKRCDGR
jgi:hypothetical protein